MGSRLEAERLEAELAVVCGQLNQVSARLVAVTARAIACEGWAGAGIRSVEHWLVLRAGLSPGRARQVVLMARRVGVLPVVMGQFAAGRLSVDQVAVVARHAPIHVEASVAELAVSASVPQLGRVLSRYAFDPPTGDDPDPGSEWSPGRAAAAPGRSRWRGVEPALDEVGRAGEPAELSMGTREGGRFELRFWRRPMSGRWWRRRCPRPGTRCSARAAAGDVGRCAGARCATGRWGR